MDTNRQDINTKPEATASDRTFEDRVISACAEACNVDQQLIARVCHATPEEEDRMNHHIETGTYLEQIVLQFDHILRYKSDLSVPASHGHAFMLDVWEHDDYISIHASWDSRILECDNVEHMIQKFADFFTAILEGHDKTVGEMMGQCSEVEREATASATSPSTLRASSTEFEGCSD